MHFGQPAFVLGLQVQTPFHRKLELVAGFLQQAHRIGVFDALERLGDEGFQLADRGFVHALGEKCQVIHALIEHGLEHVFQERLGQIGVVVEIGEGNLRLDHPELGQMPRGVGVFSAEGGAKGVDLAQRQAVSLDIELAGDGKKRLFAEKIA